MAFIGTVDASAKYQQWLEEAFPADGPGAAAIVVRDNDVLFRRASGMADMESRRKGKTVVIYQNGTETVAKRAD